MASRTNGDLRSLSLEELKRRSTSINSPIEIVRSRDSLTSKRNSSASTSSPVAEPIHSDTISSTFDGVAVSTNSKFTGPAAFDQYRQTTPYQKKQASNLADSVVVGECPSGRAERNSGRANSTKQPPFGSRFSAGMVREQEPARLPLVPSKVNLQSVARPLDNDNKAGYGSASTVSRPTSFQAPILPHPQFGRPSALGPTSSPYKASSNLSNPAPRQTSGSRQNGDSSMFIPSKPGQTRPEYHRPPQSTNPLHQVKDLAYEQAKKWFDEHAAPKAPLLPASQTSNPLDALRPSLPLGPDFVEIPSLSTGPTWGPRPVAPPMFSSQTTSNPYYTSKNYVDLTTSTIGMSTNQDLFDDRYGVADPQMYLDSGKANENIKALLEGAFEDEEDKPRTRRRRKQLQEEADDLADKLNDMTVKSEDANAEDREDEDDGTVEGLKVKLLPHQIEGVAWMRDKETGTKKTRGVLPKGGILADDMGLGKTIQSIALMLENPKPNPEDAAANSRKFTTNVDKGTLVVAPLALIKQWEGEIKDRVDSSHAMRVCVHHGPQRTKSYKELKKYDVVITTYQTLSSEHASSQGSLKVGCFGVNWYRVILDEAHSIKNRNAKATKAACALEAEYRWCLTGTPMQNNLDELQSLIHFLRIKPYEDLNAWRDQITRPMNSGRGGLAIKRLQVYLKAFMKRRTKDVLKQEGALKINATGKPNVGKSNGFKIVKRTVESVEADFTPEERTFYQRLETRADKSLERMMAGNKVSYASALVLLLRLRQACNHPKLIGGDLAKEKDTFTNGSGSQTPGRKKAVADDIDSIADMLGGLSVETKRCDVCQIELASREASSGAIRCIDCEADVQDQGIAKDHKKQRRKEKKAKKTQNAQLRRTQNRRVVVDSDEEDFEDGCEGRGADSEDEAIKPQSRGRGEVVSLISDSEDDIQDDEINDEDEDDEETDSDGSLYGTGVDEDLVSSTKIRHLISLLRADATEHKYIVFSFFTSMLDLIEPILRNKIPGVKYTRYDGQMRNDAREASLEQLRSNPKCRILLCSLRAGSLGLNLTAASRVVILEPFWNPFVEEQAIDRVHRLNQTRDVVVYKLTVRDTVESRILELQEKKRELANATIEGKLGAGKLTLQDMLKLFRREAEGEHKVDMVGMRDKGGLLREGERTATSAMGHRPEKKKEHEVYGRRW